MYFSLFWWECRKWEKLTIRSRWIMIITDIENHRSAVWVCLRRGRGTRMWMASMAPALMDRTNATGTFPDRVLFCLFLGSAIFSASLKTERIDWFLYALTLCYLFSCDCCNNCFSKLEFSLVIPVTACPCLQWRYHKFRLKTHNIQALSRAHLYENEF